MRAWEIRRGNLGLHDLDSVHPGEGETVVRVSHVGICGSDLPKLLRPVGFALPEPWRPGHEIVGIDPTDRFVAVDPLVPCGTCHRCIHGDIHLCAGLLRLGWDLPGGFAEQMVVPAENAHPLPKETDPLHATLADPAAVAIHGLRCNHIAAGGRLAIVGAGTIGLLTALYARQQGWQVTVVYRDGHPPHESVRNALPAAFQQATAISPRETFDVVVDAATGASPEPLELALRFVADGGTIIVQNAYHPGVRLPTTLREMFRRSLRLIGSFSYCRRGQDDFALALDLLRSHAGQVSDLVSVAGELEELPTVLNGRRTRSVRQVLAVRSEYRAGTLGGPATHSTPVPP